MEHEPSLSKTPDSFFDGDEQTRDVNGAVLEVVKEIGEMKVCVGKSQVASPGALARR